MHIYMYIFIYSVRINNVLDLGAIVNVTMLYYSCPSCYITSVKIF